MLKTIQNIKKVSIIFFILTGILHLGSSVFIANSLYLKQALLVNKTIDIPFILTGLLYGFSSLRLAMANPEKEHKTLDFSLISIIIIVLVGLLYINLFIPTLNKQ